MYCFHFNRFHICVLILWQFSKFYSTQMLFPIFANYVPKWRCQGQIGTEFAKNCSLISECLNGLEFENDYFYSSALEFNWFCGRDSYYASFYAQIQFVGVIFGTSIFGSLGDYLGRRPTSILVMIIGTFSSLFSGLVPNWQLLLVSRFFIGFSVGASLVLTTLTMELILPEQRVPMRGIANWGTARLCLTLMCYCLPNWRHATLAFVPLNLTMLLILIFVIPESPTWLHTKGKMTQMHATEQRIARIAGVEYKKSEIEEVSSYESILNLLKNRILFKRLLVFWFMFFVSALCSYGNDYNSSSIAGDFYWNQALFSIFVSISKFVLIAVDTKFPNFSRRRLHQWSQAGVILCFVALILLVIFFKDSVLILIINLFGTLLIEFTWDANFLGITESIPTGLRSSAASSCSLAARFGGIMAPMLAHLNQYWAFSTYTAVSFFGLLNLLVSYLWLVETKGVSLDDVHLNRNKLDEELKTKAIPEVIELLDGHYDKENGKENGNA